MQNKNKIKKRKKRQIKRSQLLLIGSLLVFVGVITLSYGRLRVLKELIYESVRLSIFVEEDTSKTKIEKKEEVKVEQDVIEPQNLIQEEVKQTKPAIKYDYIGYLEIPAIRLKRGFVDKNSKYNNIKYNVTISDSANMPDVDNGNFILYAHSGDAYISFFAYLYKLKLGDHAYITYNSVKYDYELVKIENLPKTGVLELTRPNKDLKELTLITCTKDSDTEQTVYYFDIR